MLALVVWFGAAAGVDALRVACIGDSITFGYRGFGPPSRSAYPILLQAMLGNSSSVENLGVSGAAMSHDSPSSYWRTKEFDRFRSSQWDAVIIMLGTNDAKDWNEACSEAALDKVAAMCQYWKSYVSMLQIASGLKRTDGQCGPEIYVAIPPPVLYDGAFQINESIANRELPRLVPALAAAAAIPPTRVIDVFGALDGRSSLLPTAGCPALLPNGSFPYGTAPACKWYYDTSWGDGIHPDDAGYRKIAQVVHDALQVDLRASRQPGDLTPSRAPGFLGCFQDGNGSKYPVAHHWWEEPGVGVRLADLQHADSGLCHAACRTRGYKYAGLIWGGGRSTQCYCASNLGEFGRDPKRRLPDYQCCPVCLNYDLSIMDDPPCTPDLYSCGAWMTLSAFWVGPTGDKPCLPPSQPPPSSPPPSTSPPTPSSPPPAPSRQPPSPPIASIAGRSVYFVLIDRFARSGAAASNTSACAGDDWCGGSLRGILTQLDYVEGMGFDCIWVSPVVGQLDGRDGASGSGYHGYWAKDWYAIDRHYGTADELRALSAALKARGMCLILDVVVNHVMPIHGVADVARVHPFDQSEYYHTLRRRPDESFDEYAAGQVKGHPVSAFSAFAPGCGLGDYHCAGYNETVVLDGWFYDLADLDQSHPYVRSELLAWTRHMVEEYHLDGLRLDTAAYMPMDFLVEVQAEARVEILGEVTSSNLSYHASFTASHGRRGLAGLLNFPLYYTLSDGFCGAADSNGAVRESSTPPNLLSVGGVLRAQQEAPYSSLDLLGAFADNHDVARLATVCAADALRVANVLAFVMMLRGMPIVYAGTEQGLAGDAHHNRAGLWSTGYKRSAPLYGLIAQLNALRRRYRLNAAEPSNATSSVATVGKETLVYKRAGGAVLVLVNNRAEGRALEPIEYCLDTPPADPPEGSAWMDALSGVRVEWRGRCVLCPDGQPKVLVIQPAASHQLPVATVLFVTFACAIALSGGMFVFVRRRRDVWHRSRRYRHRFARFFSIARWRGVPERQTLRDALGSPMSPAFNSASCSQYQAPTLTASPMAVEISSTAANSSPSFADAVGFQNVEDSSRRSFA